VTNDFHPAFHKKESVIAKRAFYARRSNLFVIYGDCFSKERLAMTLLMDLKGTPDFSLIIRAFTPWWLKALAFPTNPGESFFPFCVIKAG
jgi:hypothetical protein